MKKEVLLIILISGLLILNSIFLAYALQQTSIKTNQTDIKLNRINATVVQDASSFSSKENIRVNKSTSQPAESYSSIMVVSVNVLKRRV
jgi:hypothetical protein